MNPDERRCPDSLTERVIGAILEVSNTLGAGCLEKLYERALLRELELRGIRASGQASFGVTYKGQHIGTYYSDILGNEHTAQCPNYLRVSGRSVCLLVNFQRPKVEWLRIVHGHQAAESVESGDEPALLSSSNRLPPD